MLFEDLIRADLKLRLNLPRIQHAKLTARHRETPLLAAHPVRLHSNLDQFEIVAQQAVSRIGHKKIAIVPCKRDAAVRAMRV